MPNPEDELFFTDDDDQPSSAQGGLSGNKNIQDMNIDADVGKANVFNNPNPFENPDMYVKSGVYIDGKFVPDEHILSIKEVERPYEDTTTYSFVYHQPKEPVIDYEDVVESETEMQELARNLFENANYKERVTDEYKKEIIHKRLKLIKEKVEEDIKDLRRKERRTGSSAGAFKVLTTLLAAIVTVLLGLNISGVLEEPLWYYKTRVLVEVQVKEPGKEIPVVKQAFKEVDREGLRLSWFINTAALIITAFLTLLSDLQAFYDSKEYWLKYTDTANKLEMLLENIEYLELGGDYVSMEDVNEIKFAYDKIKENLNNYIIYVRADEDTRLISAVMSGEVYQVSQEVRQEKREREAYINSSRRGR
ncbi:MAG: hypothetical protein NZ551_10455 [Microscillaceae bacterium]|nr:hypothetical protein [Microscillaceae bacterium]MDW8461619.1 hypothetical protein [Cytophagales bacterium]